MRHISHDFETYSEADLKEVGAWAYSQHPSTEVLSWALKIDDEEPQVFFPADPDDPNSWRKLTRVTRQYRPEDHHWYAWNAWFEWCIWVNTLGLPPPPTENWFCTQALALALALPRDLATCGDVLGLPANLVKNPRGKELIDLLCKPDKYTGERNQDPDLLLELYDYNKQDTVAEYAIKQKTRPLIPHERRIWQIDLEMNIRGVPLDTELLHSAATVYEGYKTPLKQKLIERTGLKNPNSGPQFRGWLAEQGHPLPNLQKATITEFLATCDDPELKRTIQWRSALARTPLTKYGKIAEKMGTDGRFHGALSYHVATTGRWSSTGVNFQNLSHATLAQEQIELCIAALKLADAPLIEALYDDPIEAMSSCLRGVLRAEPGKRLIVADYKAIEARVIAWLAGHTERLRIFSTHGKIYEYAATQLFGIDHIDDVAKDSVERQAGKVSELALGFQGGYRALLNMARTNGIDLEAIAWDMGHGDAETFAKGLVKKWRAANPQIERLWHDTERAAIRAVANPGTVHWVGNKYCFKKIPGMLLMKLPSGRQLAFFQPTLHEGVYDKPELRYWCVNSKTHKWAQKHSYGGDLAQSATQGIARDVMAHAMPNLVTAGYALVMLVHDEIIAEMPWGVGSLAEVIQIMRDKAEWAAGLPIDADGFEDERYQEK